MTRDLWAAAGFAILGVVTGVTGVTYAVAGDPGWSIWAACTVGLAYCARLLSESPNAR